MYVTVTLGEEIKRLQILKSYFAIWTDDYYNYYFSDIQQL